MQQQATPARLVEIACDESGAEGEKLLDGNTDVFAHASVELSNASAAACISEVRDRIRSPALEYKANHLLREKHRPVLVWLLGRSGPVLGSAHVQLTDKRFLLISRVAELITGGAPGAGQVQDPGAAAVAVTLYAAGQRETSPQRWHAFLAAFNDLMRARNGWAAPTTVDSFFDLVDVLRHGSAPGQLSELMELLWLARPRAASFFEVRAPGSREIIPALDPLLPAIVLAVAYWGAGGQQVSVVHDRQTTLTQERIAQLIQICGEGQPALPWHAPGGRLASLRLVESSSDPRVQVADFLAGVARKIASDELNGRGDSELTALLRPYVDCCSIWGDATSWQLIGRCGAGSQG